jgi:hypothetical protein
MPFPFPIWLHSPRVELILKTLEYKGAQISYNLMGVASIVSWGCAFWHLSQQTHSMWADPLACGPTGIDRRVTASGSKQQRAITIGLVPARLP